jgi:hypothetical protein
MRQLRIRSAGLPLALTTVFHWRTLWPIFSIRQLRHGTLPIRDPYGHPGRTFIGEMQKLRFFAV